MHSDVCSDFRTDRYANVFANVGPVVVSNEQSDIDSDGGPNWSADQYPYEPTNFMPDCSAIECSDTCTNLLTNLVPDRRANECSEIGSAHV